MSIVQRHPRYPLFPYTTLFRSALRQTAALSFRPVLGAVAPEGTEEQDPSDGGGEGTEDTDETSTAAADPSQQQFEGDRKSTRLNSSHVAISYAVFCLKQKPECT